MTRKMQVTGALALLAIVIVGCPKPPAPVPPAAAFSGAPTTGLVPLTVEFTDASTSPDKPITEWWWEFGDGAASNDQDPTHIYTAPGTYTVSLRVTNADGADTATRTDYITVNTAPPAADFTADVTQGLMPLQVAFADASDPGTAPITTWAWDFGDGGTSTAQNPAHTYEAQGTYTVALTVTTAHGADTATKTDYITVDIAGPAAAFIAEPTEGLVALDVQFTDQSDPGTAPITAWAWDFGDTTVSTEQNPLHTYDQPGQYTVALTVTTDHGQDTFTARAPIVVNTAPPTAAFSASPKTGLTPLEVQFVDESLAGTATIASWLWDFGDSGSSTEQSPMHVYDAAGEYQVSLTVTTAHGENSKLVEAYIKVVDSPVAMRDVAEGWFEMGARVDDEVGSEAMLPRHYVYLDEYQIGQFEVTNQQYCDVLNWVLDKDYIVPQSGDIYTAGEMILELSSPWCQIMYADGAFSPRERDGVSMANHPVVKITWAGAVAYCNWLSELVGLTPCYDLATWRLIDPLPNGFRLPTEAEWERAAGWDPALNEVILPDWDTGGHWLYGYTGDQINTTRCNYALSNPLGLSEHPLTAPVGYYDGVNPNTLNGPSPAGCYDMSGNVSEWCHDWYAAYTTADQVNPFGPADGVERVRRGGGWSTDVNSAGDCRSAYRIGSQPGVSQSMLGFRVARSVR